MLCYAIPSKEKLFRLSFLPGVALACLSFSPPRCPCVSGFQKCSFLLSPEASHHHVDSPPWTVNSLQIEIRKIFQWKAKIYIFLNLRNKYKAHRPFQVYVLNLLLLSHIYACIYLYLCYVRELFVIEKHFSEHFPSLFP